MDNYPNTTTHKSLSQAKNLAYQTGKQEKINDGSFLASLKDGSHPNRYYCHVPKNARNKKSQSPKKELKKNTSKDNIDVLSK